VRKHIKGKKSKFRFKCLSKCPSALLTTFNKKKFFLLKITKMHKLIFMLIC